MKNTMKIYQYGKLVKVVQKPARAYYAPKIACRRLSKNRVGTNQYKAKRKSDYKKILLGFTVILIMIMGIVQYAKGSSVTKIISPIPVAQAEEKISVTPTPTIINKPSELEEIVAYIARRFEPEGKAIVVRAINCFYSESGLRSNAVGHNTDAVKSTDYGVAQLNGYWHKLTPEQKTDVKANIDKAYEIYKGRGNSFSAWYGKLCN